MSAKTKFYQNNRNNQEADREVHTFDHLLSDKK